MKSDIEVKNFTELINKHKKQEAAVICTGPSYQKYSAKIKKFLYDGPKLGFILINNNCSFIDDTIDTYHVFTNNIRLTQFCHKISKNSKVLLGRYIKEETLKLTNIKSYYKINYTDRDTRELPRYKNGTIYGFYRGVGQLSIMLAHLMGAERIWVIGMDGYSIDNKNMHYYKDDKSDRYAKETMEWRNEHNKLVQQCLKRLKIYGIDFFIITPTIHKEHYFRGLI